ncbi:DUF2887 domain-containing protein [Leptolyngbya sp. FACHB-541]
MLLPTGTAKHPVYFSEVQFQKDKQRYHRLFAELLLYWETASWNSGYLTN